MRLLILVLCSLSLFLSGCALNLDLKPRPMKEKLFDPYKSSASLRIVNTSDKGRTQLEGVIYNDLKVSSQQLVDALGRKLSESGVSLDNKSDKILKVSIGKISFPRKAPFTYPCEVILNVEIGNSGVRKIVTKDRGMSGWEKACNYTIAKAVADLYNDKELRAYIDDKPFIPESGRKNDVAFNRGSAEKRLEKLKSLLDKGLISRGDYNKKKDAILSEM